MKKIIYSLVIMIAAGSLFTSCVTNTEPQGIKDIREAKANYLDALANLRAADAAVRNADAEYRKAETELKQAEAAIAEAAAKAAEIAVELEDAAVQAKIAEIKAQAEIDAVKAQKKLAKAQAALEETLKDLAAKSMDLTEEEGKIVEAYTAAYKKVIKQQIAVREAEQALYDATYNSGKDTLTSVERAKADYEQDKANAEWEKAYWEYQLAEAQEMSEAQIVDYEEWVAKYDALIAENEGFKYDSVEIEKRIALNEFENKDALDKFYKEIKDKQDAITKAEAAAGTFKLEFTGKKAIALPKLNVSGVNVVDNFAENVNDLIVPVGQWINAENDTLGIKITNDKVAEGVVDTLNIIIDALKREQVVVDQLVKDTAGLGALVAKTTKEYNDTKKALEAGVDAYKPIADSVAATKKAKETFDAAKSKFVADTAALIKSVKDFVEVWNNVASKRTVKRADSTEVFEAFINVMKAREAAVETAEKNLRYHFYGYSFSPSTGVVKAVPDSAKFSDLNVKGIWNDNDELNYAGDKALDGSYVAGTNRFQKVLSAAFGCTYFDGKEFESGDEIKFDEIVTATGYLQTALFKEYWVNYYTKNADWGKVITVNPGTVYESTVVKEAKTAWDKAKNGEKIARENYYEKVYSKFWGINPAIKESPTDSLKIVYTEKTFTEPTVLPKFKFEDGFFNHAEGKTSAYIDTSKVTLKPSKALDVIKAQFGDVDYLQPKGHLTLYAQYLATVQFANDAKNYKENTAALKELETVVATVKTAYDAAVAAMKSGSALADSLIVKYLGNKDTKKYTEKYDENVVNYRDGKKNVEEFIVKGNLAGEQKELVDKYLADYAKAYLEIVKEGKTIDKKAEANRALAEIYSAYIVKLYVLDQKHMKDADDAGDPHAVYEAVENYWLGVLDEYNDNIEEAEDDILAAEAALQKLEAGYSTEQLAIEKAQADLAKAQAKLEELETKLAFAEAAYKQVLANHGLAE